MERKSWRVWVLVVLAAALIMGVGIAGAEGGRSLKTRMPAPVRRRGVDFDGPNTVETCVESTWTITNSGFLEGGGYYEYTMAIDDGSHPDGYTDTQYASARTTGTSFSYTFYQPGKYWLYVEKYGAAEGGDPLGTLYLMITVTEGSGENALMNAVAAAAAACRSEDDFRTVEKINQYLCDHVEYDYTFTYYSPEAALLHGTGVCNSYSRAFELIATACDLPCRRVSGKAGGGGHAWNLVKMDGKWYQIDLTWNDTGGERHLYFGLTDTLIGHDHSNMYIVGGDSIACDAMDDNWFIYTGEWDTRLARSTKGYIQASIDNGATLIEQSLDKIYTDTTSGSYYPKNDKYWLYGNILAYGYSQKIWAGPNGTLLKGPFTYDYNSSTLSATLSAVSNGLIIENTLNRTTFEVGEEFSFTAQYITGDATGITLTAKILENGLEKTEYSQTSQNSTGDFRFQIWETGVYELEISAFRDGQVLASEGINITIEPGQGPGPEPGPVQGIWIEAGFQQSRPQAGQALDLDWNISGGSGSYTDVQIEWVVAESVLEKTMRTDHFTASSGTASYTPPTFADRVTAVITVTDSDERTESIRCYASLEGYQHDDEAWCILHNNMDYVQVGEQVSANWEINEGKHTITNVRYRWVTECPVDEYGMRLIESPWTNVGNSLSGTETYTTTEAGLVYFDIAFDAEDGWGCSHCTTDRIQVLNSGETPLTAEINILPAEPKTGEDITIEWNVTGATDSADIAIYWDFNAYNGTLYSDSINQAAATDSTTLTLSEEGWLYAWISVFDPGRRLQIRKEVSLSVSEPTGITLTVSPEHPVIGQPMTISWEITREGWDSAELGVELYSGNLKKKEIIRRIAQENGGTGYVTYTPMDGDSLTVYASVSTGVRTYTEKTELMALTGNWNAPEPVQVNVTYQVQETDGVSHIIADYAITGGTGNIDSIEAMWYRIDMKNGIVGFHERKLGKNTTGRLTYTPFMDGDYALVFSVYDWESGWYYLQSARDVTDTATVTGVSQTALGLDFYEGVPEAIRPDELLQITWDVTGGDSIMYRPRETAVHAETDDGIVLRNYTVYGFTGIYTIPAWDIGENSQYVIIELTPADSSTTGKTVTIQIPIIRNVAGRLILPRNLTRIESEAFLNVAAEEIDIPDGVTFIGENAFPSGVTLIVGSGSYAYEWAGENGYTPTVR